MKRNSYSLEKFGFTPGAKRPNVKSANTYWLKAILIVDVQQFVVSCNTLLYLTFKFFAPCRLQLQPMKECSPISVI